jgi:hypothetical protein
MATMALNLVSIELFYSRLIVRQRRWGNEFTRTRTTCTRGDTVKQIEVIRDKDGAIIGVIDHTTDELQIDNGIDMESDNE